MNTRDLYEKLRTTFECIDGVPRAYMEIRCPLPNQQIHIARFIYESVGVTMRGDVEDLEPILCGWFWQKLVSGFPQEQLEDRNVLIIFRRWPQVVEYVDGQGHAAAKLTTRLVIPGEDLRRIFGPAVKEEGEFLYSL